MSKKHNVVETTVDEKSVVIGLTQGYTPETPVSEVFGEDARIVAPRETPSGATKPQESASSKTVGNISIESDLEPESEWKLETVIMRLVDEMGGVASNPSTPVGFIRDSIARYMPDDRAKAMLYVGALNRLRVIAEVAASSGSEGLLTKFGN